MDNYKFILSGGGTGGHIYPAIAIANALKQQDSSTEILFIGARGKMEMQKVPEAIVKSARVLVTGFTTGRTFEHRHALERSQGDRKHPRDEK